MKQTLLFILFSAMAHLCMSQRTFIVDGITYQVIKESDEVNAVGLVEVTWMRNTSVYSGSIQIPNAVKESSDSYADTYKIIGIGENAFKASKQLRYVKLSPSIEYIGNSAFEGCTSLDSISIPMGNLYRIGDFAFKESRIKSITIPNSIREYGIGLFVNCRYLKSVELPSNTSYLPKGIFAQCTALESINIPENVKRIDGYAFQECSNLESIVLPSDLRSIGPGAFFQCENLTSVQIPSSIEEIQQAAFAYSGIEHIEIPLSIRDIPEDMFYGCEYLQHIVLPEGVESLGEEAFAGCTSLTRIEFPTSLQRMEKRCFVGSGLKVMIMPNTITSLGDNCFGDCKSLQKIVFSSGITSIGEGSCALCSKLQSVVIPYNIKRIGESAFYGCYELTNLQIKNPRCTIHEEAFYGCNKLSKTIEKPNVESSNDHLLTLHSVTITPTQTILSFSNNNLLEDGSYFQYCSISKDAAILVNTQMYTMTDAEGIDIDPNKTYFTAIGQDLYFRLYFPPIPWNTKKIDFKEFTENGWILEGIQLE